VLRAADLTNLAGGSGFHAVRLEALVMRPPSALVLGFFDAALDGFQRWSMGRQPVLRRLAAGRTLVSLRGSVLGCPAWFAADGAAAIARARR
jgi:iron complex transport system substrate-binding protein